VSATVTGVSQLERTAVTVEATYCMPRIGGCWLQRWSQTLQVPVMYAIFVLDLKILRWEVAKMSLSLIEDVAWSASAALKPEGERLL